MGQLQKENGTHQAQTQRQLLESKFHGARHNILLVVIFTLINVLLLVTNSNTYFLFSSYIPYLLADLGMLLCGMYPVEVYGGDLAGWEFLDKSFLVVTLVIAAVVLVLYLLCWIVSKKNKVGWMILALVLFGVDTALMFLINGIALEAIIDIIFHGWVIFSLASGIIAHYKWKKLPVELSEPVEFVESSESNPEEAALQSSCAIRFADEDVKARILLETEALGHKITYRRVKKVNELIVDRRVYDEYTALAESAHTLRACIAGHTIEAGYDGLSHSFISVDGQIIEKKVRIF